MGQSLNCDRHPYAKRGFTGTTEVRDTYDRINESKKRKTLPLMNDIEWKLFCIRRNYRMGITFDY